MVDSRNEIVRNMKQRVRTPQFLNRVIKVYDFTTLFTRLMMYKRAKSSLVQPKKEGEEETMYNMYNSMFIRIKKKNKFNDKKMARILKRFYNISPTSTVEVMHTCMEYLSSLDGTIPRELFEENLDKRKYVDQYFNKIEEFINEFDIAMYVKKYIDDPDGYDGIAFSRYLADLKRTGKYIDWEEMI